MRQIKLAMRIQLVTLIATVFAFLGNAAVLKGSLEEELNLYKARVRYIYRVVAVECPQLVREKRDAETNHPTRLEIQKGIYEELVALLVKCRELTTKKTTLRLTTAIMTNQTKALTSVNTSEMTNSTTRDHTTPTILQQTTLITTKRTTSANQTLVQTATVKQLTSTTEKQTSASMKWTTLNSILQTTPTNTLKTTPIHTLQTTPIHTLKTTPTSTTQTATPKPTKQASFATSKHALFTLHYCALARNYTESWRREHEGKQIRGDPVYNQFACDFHNTHWFRFSGEAGNRMLDTCPKPFSCGTVFPYWTDEKMPMKVGVIETITLYSPDTHGGCKSGSAEIEVMRCSLNSKYDFIYRHGEIDRPVCNKAFCGMR